MKLCVYCIAKNEEQFVNRFMDSIADEADLVLVADTGSTDRTIELFKKRGAKVVSIIVDPWRFDTARNMAMAAVPSEYDTLFSVDIDEIVTPVGWRKLVQTAFDKLPSANQIQYMYTTPFSASGKFKYNKIHTRDFFWSYPCHEILVCHEDSKEVVTQCYDLNVVHLPDMSKQRSSYLDLLKIGVSEKPNDSRAWIYYGRELYYRREWSTAIGALATGLKFSYWDPESARICIWMSECYEQLGDSRNAQKYYREACTKNSGEREPYYEAAKYFLRVNDYSNCYRYATLALTATTRSLHHYEDVAAWNGGVEDLIGVSSWYIGKRDESLTYSKLALDMMPKDERVRKNYEFVTANHKIVNKPKATDTTVSANNTVTDVDVIITTYGNMQYLDLCVKSIKMAIGTLKPNIIVVDAYKDKLNFSEAVNTGLRQSTAAYVCILNDDVIVSKNWLDNLHRAYVNSGVGIIGPLSNCDKGWLHNNAVRIAGIGLEPGIHTYEQIRPIVLDIVDYESPYKQLINRDWIAFYCVFMSRNMLEQVGYLNEDYINDYEDKEYCLRANNRGFKIAQTYDTFVFHFGGKSRDSKLAKKLVDKEGYDRDMCRNKLLLSEFHKDNTVVIYSGQSVEKWDGHTLKTGIGGSETWQIRLSEELVKRGYSVLDFSDCPKDGETINGVQYIRHEKFEHYNDTHQMNTFISSRTVYPFNTYNIHAKHKVVMAHDVYLFGHNNGKIPVNKFDYCLCLSQAHRDYLKQFHNIPDNKLIITANGIDLDRFNHNIIRNPLKCIYASSPDRGLETLLYNIWPELKCLIPEMELHVYGNRFDSHWDKTNAWRKRVEMGLDQAGITSHGRVGQDELAKAYQESTFLLYPCLFEETFCITALEAMAGGCVVVSSGYWGLNDIVSEAGCLVPINERKEVYSKEYHQKFITNTIELLRDRNKLENYRRKGLEKSKNYTWDKVAAQFDDYIKTGIFKDWSNGSGQLGPEYVTL